uniref:Cuticle protein 6 n=1 Tax=Photinus pyralis TaxID=7054 RepID=A0A1Y1MH17_PHOPY
MRFYHVAAILAVSILPPSVRTSNDGWSDPSKAQYHIQTDEGPERYFRYQTISGQYRKEKRLEDGTVIGTYGWVDDDGIFRMRDYIADNAGYRILKTKNVFVGRNRPVSQALSIAKQAPAEAGTLVDAGRSPVVKTTPSPFVSSPKVNFLPAGFSVANHQPAVFKFNEYNVPQTTPSYVFSSPSTYGGHTPDVELSLNSIPSSTESPLVSSTIAPSTTSPPPLVSTTPQTIYIPSTTPTPSTHYQSPSVQYVQPTSTLLPPISSNAIDSPFYSSNPQYEHYTDNHRFINPYVYQNGPTYPIDKNGHTYNGHSNNLGNGYNPQFALYDGVSVTNDGFRYYIPKQYHEEQSLPGNEKSGSFGYIDPFGIRRVIYYNAGADGFKHRKNNRYVGFDATPYDPRPY